MAMASPVIAVPRSVAGVGRCGVFMVTGCIGLTALAPERPTAISDNRQQRHIPAESG
jgi:hypothetical protein